MGVSPTTWARWEQGIQGVRAYSRSRLIELFGVEASTVDMWLEGEEPDPLPPWDSVSIGYTSLAATVQSCCELWRWDVDPARRRILASLPFAPAALSEWLLSWQLDPTDTTRAHAGTGPSVGIEDVHRVQEATQSFDQMDRQFGGGLVRPAVTAYLDNKVTPLLHGTYTDEVGSHLMTAAALMTALAGWEAYDTGLHGLAQQHYGQALKLAKAGNDQLTAARVLSVLAQQAIDLEHPQWAIRLASAARQAGAKAQAPPRVEAMLTLREATATAQSVALSETFDAGMRTRVRQLIGAAEDKFADAAPDDAEPAWITYFSPAELAAQVGYCWQLIGEHECAAGYAEQAVRDLGTPFSRALQFNLVHKATAQLGLGELEEALESARAAVPMAKSLTSRRSIEMVKAFDERLAPYSGERQVRDWRDYLRTEFHAVAS